MSNAIAFSRPKLQRYTITCDLVVDPTAPLEEKCLFAWSIGIDGPVFVDRYSGRSGRDGMVASADRFRRMKSMTLTA
jgi:hypothetical protein